MSPDETRTLLSGASVLDRWLNATDADMAQEMVSGWSRILEAVPLAFAQRTVRDHYAAPEARTIQPGDIAGAWRAQRRHDQDLADAEARRTEAATVLEATTIGDVIALGGAGEYLRAMQAAIGRGEDPRTVARPAGVRVRTYSPEAEARERRCTFWEVCICTHTECRDGWLDDDTTVVGANGRSYAAAQRCPRCEEGLQMAQERGIARKPRRAAGR